MVTGDLTYPNTNSTVENVKRCSRCKTHKSVSKFNKRSDAPDGRQYLCASCIVQSHKAAYALAPAAHTERTRNWKLANPEKHKAITARRRKRLSNALGGRFDSSRLDYMLRVKMYGDTCAYCLDGAWQELDHVIPISRAGGSNYATNIVPVCRKCQQSKYNKLLHTEWSPPGLKAPLHLYPALEMYYPHAWPDPL